MGDGLVLHQVPVLLQHLLEQLVQLAGAKHLPVVGVAARHGLLEQGRRRRCPVEDHAERGQAAGRPVLQYRLHVLDAQLARRRILADAVQEAGLLYLRVLGGPGTLAGREYGGMVCWFADAVAAVIEHV